MHDNAESQRERKARERARSRTKGWEYVSVRVPPRVGDEIKRLADRRRQEWLGRGLGDDPDG